jgi:pimeloyl-ACP methyl ester carboxylesterase
MGLVGKILLGVGLLLVALVAAGAGYQWLESRADRERFPPPGRLVDVNGLEIHLDCRGSGRPVVILEAGLTSGSSTWGRVHDAMSRTTEVCAYDRPGMDWSEPMGRPAEPGEVAGRLHALIEAAAIDGPYVLLGMSAGGVYVREYFRRFPGDVVGMVLVDSSHEQQRGRLPPAGNPADMERLVTLCRWLQPIGVVRWLRSFDALVNQPAVPEGLRPLLLANLNQTHHCAAMQDEITSFTAELMDADPPTSLGDLPLMVLSQGNEPLGSEASGVTDQEASAQRAVWDELQEELAALSSRGQRLIAERSGHVIQLEQPELVIDAVAALVAELRR